MFFCGGALQTLGDLTSFSSHMRFLSTPNKKMKRGPKAMKMPLLVRTTEPHHHSFFSIRLLLLQEGRKITSFGTA